MSMCFFDEARERYTQLLASSWFGKQSTETRALLRAYPVSNFYQLRHSGEPVRIYGVGTRSDRTRVFLGVVARPYSAERVDAGIEPTHLERVGSWCQLQTIVIESLPSEWRSIFTDPISVFELRARLGAEAYDDLVHAVGKLG